MTRSWARTNVRFPPKLAASEIGPLRTLARVLSLAREIVLALRWLGLANRPRGILLGQCQVDVPHRGARCLGGQLPFGSLPCSEILRVAHRKHPHDSNDARKLSNLRWVCDPEVCWSQPSVASWRAAFTGSKRCSLVQYDDPLVRAAYIRGAHDAHDSSVLSMLPADAQAMEQWLSDLDAWDGGNPPPPPNAWPSEITT